MLRTYFWSLPRVAPTDGSRTRSGSKRLRFSVAVTNEMFLPLPLAFDLALGLSTDGAEFRRLDGQEGPKSRTGQTKGAAERQPKMALTFKAC